jgi:hypothetical protein
LPLTLRDTKSAILDWNAYHGRLSAAAAALHCFEMTGLIDRKAGIEWLNRHKNIRQNGSSRNSIAPIDQTVTGLAG